MSTCLIILLRSPKCILKIVTQMSLYHNTSHLYWSLSEKVMDYTDLLIMLRFWYIFSVDYHCSFRALYSLISASD